MALSATIFKANLQVSDMNRHYYADHQLTLARHPSETDERMMVRLLAFALHAGEHLSFTKGLCVDDEPALWQKSLSDEIELWMKNACAKPAVVPCMFACTSMAAATQNCGGRTTRPSYNVLTI
jgi:uncharacterized protein YaeQ